MKRTLVLKRETLADLTVDELGHVFAAGLPSGLTCPLTDCTALLTTRCNTLPNC